MRPTVQALIVSACVLAAAVAVNAQGPAPKNLKVLPSGWTNQQIGALMRTFTTSLGVQCNHCHAEDPNAPPPNPGQQPRLDYSLDDKPEKEVARTMIKMVMEINGTALSGVGDASVPEKVTCFTCHNGEKTPAIAPPDGWGRGAFSLSEAGPVVPARGRGRGPAPAGPAAGPGGGN